MPSCLQCENAFPFPAPVKYKPVSGNGEVVIYGRCIIKDEDFTDEASISKENDCEFFVKADEIPEEERVFEKPDYGFEELADLGEADENEANDSGEGEETTDVPPDNGEEGGDDEEQEESEEAEEDEEEVEDDAPLRISRLDIFDDEEL